MKHIFYTIFVLLPLVVSCADNNEMKEDENTYSFLTGIWEQYAPSPSNAHKYYHVFNSDKTMYSYMVIDGFENHAGDTIPLNEDYQLPYQLDTDKIYRLHASTYTYRIDKDTLYINTFQKSSFNEYRNKFIRKRI